MHVYSIFFKSSSSAIHVLRHAECNKITRLTKARIEAPFAGIEILTSESVAHSPSSLSPSLSFAWLYICMHFFSPPVPLSFAALGDKSAAIANVNRYERGRQTKYTDVNIHS